MSGWGAWHDAAVQMPPGGPATARELLREYCRQLAELVSWDRSVGDDTPRFGQSFRDRADGLHVAARRLAAHPSLSGDVDLAHRVAALGSETAREVTDPSFNRDVIAAGHEVAEQAEDALGVVWRAPDVPDVIEILPPGA